jgi:hypothetical protein
LKINDAPIFNFTYQHDANASKLHNFNFSIAQNGTFKNLPVWNFTVVNTTDLFGYNFSISHPGNGLNRPAWNFTYRHFGHDAKKNSYKLVVGKMSDFPSWNYTYYSGMHFYNFTMMKQEKVEKSISWNFTYRYNGLDKETHYNFTIIGGQMVPFI